MSDIYLQITETPTVVTLSAPVISGALSSTVTVANVVTVALDSNSLSALENVTVTVGAAVSISNFPATQTIAGTVTANPTGTQTIAGTVTANVPLSVDGFTATTGIRVIGAGVDGGLRIQGIDPNAGFSPANLEEGGGIPIFSINNNAFPISGTVSVGGVPDDNGIPYFGIGYFESPGSGLIQVSQDANCGLPINGTVTIGSAIPTGTNSIGVVTIGGGTVAIGAGTAQIGSVTASISNSVTIASFATSVTARLINPAGTAVTYAEVGTAGNPSIDVLSVQGVTSGTPINVYPQQGTTVSNTNFTSITASTSLVSAVAGREVLTVFNEGAGNLHISPGATCTTVAYQVRLSAGDYWECPQGQLSLAHTAVFATAGTARVCQVS